MRAGDPSRVSVQFMDTELASELYVDEVLTGDGRLVILDTVRSMRGLIRFDSRWDCERNQMEIFPEGSPHGSS